MGIKGAKWKLNRKDRKVLRLLKKGFTAQEVAEKLYLDEVDVRPLGWRPIIDMGDHFKSYLDKPKEEVDNSYMDYINS
ncbi:MAG: hypothetical protein J6U54_13365 [Clostridiales bacterium]|nr:hypothetical protein [Clostridiales bacterium]